MKKKNIISETINSINPILNPLDTYELWLPLKPSIKISKNQRVIKNKIEKNPKEKTKKPAKK